MIGRDAVRQVSSQEELKLARPRAGSQMGFLLACSCMLSATTETMMQDVPYLEHVFGWYTTVYVHTCA